MNNSNLVALLWRRKRLLLLCGLLTAVASFGISRLIPRSFLAEGTLVVENRSSDMQGGQQSVTAVANVTTQAEVITSLGLIQSVVDREKLVDDTSVIPQSRLPKPVVDGWSWVVAQARDLRNRYYDAAPVKDPELAAQKDTIEKYVKRYLGATVKDNSSLITVTFEAGTPEAAARVTNAAMETYLEKIHGARQAQIANADAWIAKETETKNAQIALAEKKVADFVKKNYMAEVQGSQTAAIQLSKDQEQLVAARLALSKAQAAYVTIKSGGTASSTEALNLKSIQDYKAAEAKINADLGLLPGTDPRRASVMQSLAAVKVLLEEETKRVLTSLSREVAIAQANVTALEKQIEQEIEVAQGSQVAGTTLTLLKQNVDAKRQALISFFAQLGAVRVAAEQAPTSHILFRAKAPEKPARSYGALSLVVGMIGGVAGCSGALLLSRIMRPKVVTADDVRDVTGVQVFGMLPDITRGSDHDVIRETFRAMWLDTRSQDNKGTVVLVTSSESGEGKTTVAKALALRWASDEFRVLLIDADLRRPRLARDLGQFPLKGLKDVMEGRVELKSAVIPHPESANLDCLLVSNPNDRDYNPVKTLASPAFKVMLDNCRAEYDFVILDSPPVIPVADPILLAKLSQKIVFIVQAGRLDESTVKEAMERFDDADRAKIMTLLTRVPRNALTTVYGQYTSKAA